MSQNNNKRHSDSKDTHSAKVPRFRSVVNEVMWVREVENTLEPLIRKVVKEEVEVALRKHLCDIRRSCGREVHTSESRSLQLRFLNKISLPVFTGTKIEGDSSPIKIALVDTLSGQFVDSGPQSSAKVEIVVLEGDFDGDEGKNWKVEEFKNNIVREREGKKPLLTGDLSLNLKDGIVVLEDISFTDNSSWTRSRRFRLGARSVKDYDGVKIKEAISDSFIVRDHRGELYKKHHPPSLLDEVWRLEKIGKGGAFHKRLKREKVYTVKDFLVLLTLDQSRLRKILGTGMSAKMWEVTVEHAHTCVLDKKMYVQYPPGCQQKNGVVFNVVGQLMGILSEGHYISENKISEKEKADAHHMIIAAFQHWEEVITFDDETSLEGGSSQLNIDQYFSRSPRLARHNIDKFDDTQQISPDIISTMYSVENMSSLDDYMLDGIANLDVRNDQALNYPGEVGNSFDFDLGSISRAFNDVDHLQFLDADYSNLDENHDFERQADLQCAVEGFFYPHPRAITAVKAQRRWAKVFSVFKWMLVRKTVRTQGQEIKGCRYAI